MNDLIEIKDKLENEYDIQFYVNDLHGGLYAFMYNNQRLIEIDKGARVSDDDCTYIECFMFHDSQYSKGHALESCCGFAFDNVEEVKEYFDQHGIQRRRVEQIKWQL